MDVETRALVQRWIIAFCEMPVLIDADLMQRVLADVDRKTGVSEPDDTTRSRG
ncbi:MAG TPA: hypothetical protein VM348_09210 [Brevundimonas sp.]|nr:hypothetical protein [Brevundimonas sp.]